MSFSFVPVAFVTPAEFLEWYFMFAILPDDKVHYKILQDLCIWSPDMSGSPPAKKKRRSFFARIQQVPEHSSDEDSDRETETDDYFALDPNSEYLW